MFQREIQGRLNIYKSPLLNKQRGQGLVHGFSSRAGGFSSGIYSSLNLGLTSGDEVMDVRQNRMLFATTLGIAPERVVCGRQVHSTNIARVGKAEGGRGFLDAAAAFALARETARIAFAPNLDLFSVPSKSIIIWSISAC